MMFGGCASMVQCLGLPASSTPSKLISQCGLAQTKSVMVAFRRFAHIVKRRATMMSEHGNGEKQKETGAQHQGGKQFIAHVESSTGRILIFRVYSLILQACQAATTAATTAATAATTSA